MTPQSMDEDDIIKCIVQAGCLGTVKMTFESGPYDITRTSINADKLARAILAARDAQWVAMLGEPVALSKEQSTQIQHALIRARDGYISEDASGIPVLQVWRTETLDRLMAAIDTMARQSSPLYAIKEPK